MSWLGDALKDDPAPEDAVRTMLRRAAFDPELAPARRRLRFAGQLLVAQRRLIGVAVWLASLLVMGLGLLLALTKAGAPGMVLAMVAPIVAAAGIAGVCGRELEILATVQTSPRVVLIARVTLVFGYNLVLALLASAIVDLPALGSLIGTWLGPMALLSALCLLVSVWFGPTPAITAALTLWVTRLLAPGLATMNEWLSPLARGVELLWSTNLLSGALAAALVSAAIVVVGKGIRPFTA